MLEKKGRRKRKNTKEGRKKRRRDEGRKVSKGKMKRGQRERERKFLIWSFCTPPWCKHSYHDYCKVA